MTPKLRKLIHFWTKLYIFYILVQNYESNSFYIRVSTMILIPSWSLFIALYNTNISFLIQRVNVPFELRVWNSVLSPCVLSVTACPLSLVLQPGESVVLNASIKGIYPKSIPSEQYTSRSLNESLHGIHT